MKWVIFIAVFVAAHALSAVSRAEESGPWGFQNIAVINLPGRDLDVVQSLDRRAVELRFEKWNPDIEETIRTALLRTPLRIRLHPLRQTQMAVEIFSMTSEVDFAAKPTKKETQIIIGEVRYEKTISDLLAADKDMVPIPNVANLVRLGKYTIARNELYKNRDKHSQGTQYLFRTRVSLIDYLRRGRNAVRCPRISRIDEGDMEGYEAVLLNAWCNKDRGEPELALGYLNTIGNNDLGQQRNARLKQLKQMIISGRVLGMDRLGQPIRAAAHALTHLDLIADSLAEISFIETVGENLKTVGLSNPLAKVIQEMIASDKRSRIKELEPILVESYLEGGRNILAMDASLYFLTRPQPDWNKGRLLRVQGMSLLQAGDWKNARSSLQASRELGVRWGEDEALALIEAALREEKTSAEELNQMLKDFNDTFRSIEGYHRKWFLRLAAEIDLRLGRRLPLEALHRIPDHELFKQAQRLKTDNKLEEYKDFIKVLHEKESGWQSLARTTVEIEEMRAEIADIERLLEVIR